ncbi:hypothetical protein TDB9533_04460 [Thalassocella blandensis]|nr:hypothetical protein TDB9533_04460 [Thalassocella blandensis]
MLATTSNGLEVYFQMNISELHFISNTIKRKLCASGIVSLNQLSQLRYSPKDRLALSIELDIELEYLRVLSDMALFYQASGISLKASEILQQHGISSVEKLARLDPGKLVQIFIQYNVERNTIDNVPSFSTASAWIEQANDILLKEKNSRMKTRSH